GEDRLAGAAKLRSSIDVDAPGVEIPKLARLFAQFDCRPTGLRSEFIINRSHQKRVLTLVEPGALRCINEFPKVRPELLVLRHAAEDFVPDQIPENCGMFDCALHK